MMKYIGKGLFVQGIPARDLSKDEWDAMGKDKQKSLIKLGIFEAPKPKRKAKTLEPIEGVEEII